MYPTPPNFIDISGQKFGRLAVISREGKSKDGKATWNCVCECGALCVVIGKLLRSGQTKSCGCLVSDTTAKRNAKHGFASRGHTMSEYTIWCRMRQRCEKPSCSDYYLYGARGIIVCRRWESFENFLHDMGRRPSKSHSIDRIDVNGNYCPENCKWATALEQCNNTRRNRYLEFNGERKTVTNWASSVGIHIQTILRRLRLGWTHEEALSTPPRKMTLRPRAQIVT
jgi:hypothetical protein